MVVKNSEYFSFNNVDIKAALESVGCLFIVNDTTGRGMINQENKLMEVKGTDGKYLIDSTIPEREIEIDYTLVADDLVHLREAESYLLELLRSSDEKELSFEDQIGYFEAIYSDNSISLETNRVQQGSISFTCPKPFRYGNYVESLNKTVNATSHYKISVNTNYQIKPKIVIRPKQQTASIKLKVNGIGISYSGKVSENNSLSIDSLELETRLDNTLKVLEVDGIFPILLPGENVITINANSLLSIYYRERYL